MIAIHNVERPNIAPACEYVAMPEGSSSLAPVTKPGPNNFQNFRSFPGEDLGVLFFFLVKTKVCFQQER